MRPHRPWGDAKNVRRLGDVKSKNKPKRQCLPLAQGQRIDRISQIWIWKVRRGEGL